ncbi:MAG: PaaI family thioesterase [Pseudomonadota bacterium]
MTKTSERHTGILNGYLEGESVFREWANNGFGDIVLERWRWGALTFIWQVPDRFVMPDGVVFGGYIASVADHLTSMTAMSVLQHDDERFRTSRLETNFFRPVTKDRIRVEGRVVNASQRLIHVEADYFNSEEKIAVRVNAVQVRRRRSS